MSDRELMQQALEALEFEADFPRIGSCEPSRDEVQRTWDAIYALRARLAEPETPAPTLFRVNLLRLCPELTHEQIDELAAMARLAEPDDEPDHFPDAGKKVQPLTDEQIGPRLWWLCESDDPTRGATWTRQPDPEDIAFVEKHSGRKHIARRLVLSHYDGITGDSHD